MKKKSLKLLNLNKKSIFSFDANTLKGGWSTRERNVTTARTVRGCP